MRRGRLRWILRVVFGLLGITFIVVAIRGAMRSGEVDVPPLRVVVAGVVLLVAGLMAAGHSWAVLFEQAHGRRRLTASFLLALVARYTPAGGLSQAIGQITLSSGDEVGASQAGARFLSHAGIQVVVAGTLAGTLAFDASQPLLARALLGAALFSPILLTPRWMERIVQKMARLIRRPAPSRHLFPTRKAMVVSAAVSIAPALINGTVYAMLLAGLEPDTSSVRAVLAFIAAWVVGYLALPFPAGIGVREAVLVYLLPVPVAAAVAASVIHRLLTMVAEVALLPLAWWWSR